MSALGIHISRNDVFVSCLEKKGDKVELKFADSFQYSGNDKGIIKSLNRWYEKNLSEIKGAFVNINLNMRPVLKIVQYDRGEAGFGSTLTIKDKINWEAESFVGNVKDYALNYSIEDDLVYIAFANKDRALDFLNGLNFKVNGLDLTITGMMNILDYNYSFSGNSVSIYMDGTEVVYTVIVSGKLIDYKIEDLGQDYVESIKFFLGEVVSRVGKKDFTIFLAGAPDCLEGAFDSLKKEFKVEIVDPFFKIDIPQNYSDDKDFVASKSAFSIATGFALKGAS